MYEIEIKKRQLKLYLKKGDKTRVFDVCIGKRNMLTPPGVFYVCEKIKWPWLNTSKGKIPGGRKNPLGPRLFILSRQRNKKIKIKQGIHGSVPDFKKPAKITNGCVRMHNKDVKKLDVVPMGTKVKIS